MQGGRQGPAGRVGSQDLPAAEHALSGKAEVGRRREKPQSRDLVHCTVFYQVLLQPCRLSASYELPALAASRLAFAWSVLACTSGSCYSDQIPAERPSRVCTRSASLPR